MSRFLCACDHHKQAILLQQPKILTWKSEALITQNSNSQRQKYQFNLSVRTAIVSPKRLLPRDCAAAAPGVCSRVAITYQMLNCGALISSKRAWGHGSMLSVLVRRLGSMASSIAGDDDWHGAIEMVVAAPVEKVWAVASDWLQFPRRCTVECKEGENGVPGCVRRVQAHNSPFWVAEKLTRIDHASRILAYDLVGGNSGIAVGYKAAFQAIAEGESTTRVVWPFMFSPDQLSVESLTAVVKKKVKAHIQQLEELAQDL